MYQLATPAVMVVHAIDIDWPVAKTFDFRHDAPHWLPWTMPQVESVQPLPFGKLGLMCLITIYFTSSMRNTTPIRLPTT